MTKPKLFASIFALLLLMGGIAIAQRPARDVAPGRHPNLAAAQRLCRQAYQRVVEAQGANEWDMGGHAQRAKDLLDQASNELKAAAENANRR